MSTPTHHRVRRSGVRRAFDAFLTAIARIALRAFYREVDVRGQHHIRFGLAFDDKLALRSRILATVGSPIDVAEFVQEGLVRRERPPEGTAADPGDRVAVGELTARIARWPREAPPGCPWRWWRSRLPGL